MPKERLEDRMKIWRIFCSLNLKLSKPQLSESQAQDEVAALIARDQKDGYTVSQFNVLNMFFPQWYAKYKSWVRTDRARKAAMALWKKKKKSSILALDGPPTPIDSSQALQKLGQA